MAADIRDLETALHSLIAAYIAVLNEVTMMPRFPKTDPESQPAGPLRDLVSTHWTEEGLVKVTFTLTWRRLVDLFVKAHVKSKCKELEGALLRERYTRHLGGPGEEDRKRLLNMQEACRSVGVSLSAPSRARLIWVTVGPVLVTGVVGILGVQDIWEPIRASIPNVLTWPAMAAFVLSSIYAALFPLWSFWYKRELFLPGNTYFVMSDRAKRKLVRRHPEWGNYEPSRNIYALENAVFEKLHRQKILESKIDRLIHLFLGAVNAVLMILVATNILRLSIDGSDLRAFAVVYLASFTLFMWYPDRNTRRRTWR